ncbi:hypothetical protein NDU88_011214 [Pleurodeles waltl]|uniref:SPATA31 domain-containing protein n=1 Tax=Pleurodeles waltl TaxID=8319 RepID=A0AAV7S0F8_PLEWA|nr:hypothetical protein NDU88_011214 [Pleurodeles waltl]
MKYMGAPLETDTCQLCGNALCQECGLVLLSDGLPDGLDVKSTIARRGSSRKVRQRSLTSSNRGSGKGVPKTSNPSSQSIHHSVSMSSSDESIYGSSLRSAYPRKRSILVDCRDRACPRNCCCFGTSAWKRSCGMATSRPSDKPMRERRSRGRKRYQTDSLQVPRCPRSTTNQKRNSDTSYLSSSTSSSYRMIPSQQSLPTDASSRRLLLPGDTSGRLSSSSDDDLIQSCHSGHTTTYSGRSTPHSGTSLYSDISSMESARPLESKPAVPISSLCNDEAFSPSGVSQTLPPYARKISFPQIVDIPDSEEDSSRVSHFSCLLQEAQSTRIAHLLRQKVLHPLYGFPEPVAKSQKWAEEKQKTNEKKISQCPGKFVPKIQINDNILTPPMKEDGEGLRSDPSMETSFLSDAIKERLELHLNNKALQNVCGLPTTVQKSQGMFMPLAPKPLKPTPCRKRVKTVLAALVSSEAQQLLEAHFQKKVQKHHSTLLGKISESAQEVLPSGSPRPDHESLKDTAEMNEGPPIKITTQKTDKMNNQQTETCVSTGMEQMPSQVKEFGQNHVFLANSHLPKCVFKGQGIKRPRVGNMPSLSHDVMRSLEQNLSRKHHVLFRGPCPHPTNSQPSLPVESGTSSIMLKKKEAGFVESKTGHSRELCGQKKLLLAKGTLPVKRKQSFSVASPPPSKMQQKQGVKTSLWPREQKHASSVPKTTSSTSSLGSKPRVANGGSRRRRRRRRRKCHPAVTKRYQQMLIKGLEPCSPKPLITGSKCLLPRPCPSQENIRYVQTNGLEPCSPKPLITGSKCLLPRPCPSQEKITNVQTDGLKPYSPKPLITGSKCLLPRPCPSQEKIRNVHTDVLEPCSPKPLITGSKCLLPRPCPSQEKIRNVQTDVLEPCSPKPLITGSKCLLPRPCPSQEKIRYVQKDGLEPRSPKPLITGSKCLLPRPCPSQEKIRYVQTDGLEPRSPKPLITGSKCLLPRPCPSKEKIRYVQTDGLEPCSLKPLITWSKCLLARPCPRQENIRHVQTDGLEPCLPKPLITGNKYLLPRPCPSQENIRYVQTDGLEPCLPKPLITGSKYLLPRPCPSQENIRYEQTDNKDTHAKLPSKPHMSYKQYYSKTAAKETQMFMESESGTTTRIVNCTCTPLVQPNAMQDLEPDNTRKTLIHEQRFTAKPEMPRGAFMPSVPLERPPAESLKKKENIHINLVDVTLLNENCKHLLELHITRNVTEENHECPSSISSKTVDKLMAHMPKVSATSQCQTQPTNRNLHTSVISIRSDIYQKDANQETRSLQYNVFVSHFHKNPYMVFQHRHQLLMKHTKSEFKVHTEGLLSMEKVLFPKRSHLVGRHLKSRTTFLPLAEHNIIDTVDWNLRHKLLRHLWGLAPLHHDDYKNSNTKDLLRPPPPAEVTANTELSEVESDFLMLTQRALLEQHIQMKTMHSGWGLPTLLRSSLQAVMASSPECSSIEACPQPEDEIVMIGEDAFFSPETTRKCVESHAKQRLMLQDFGLPNTAEESLAEFFPPSTCNEALASQKKATVDVPRLPASPASTKESEANDSALLVATSKKQKGMPYKIPKDAPVQIKPPMSKKKRVQKKRGLPQFFFDFFKALIVCKLPRSEVTVDCFRISSVLGCPSFSVQIGKGHIELFNSGKELTIYSSDLSKIARTSFRVTDLHKHNDLYLQLIKRLCETGHRTIHSSLIESWTVFGTSHKLSICTPPAISKTCLRRFRKLMFFVEQDAIDCIEKNLRQKHLMSKWWFPSPHTDSACKMALARKPVQQLTHRCRVAIESPSTKILSGDSLHQLELQIAKKCIEVRLGAIPLAVKISLKAMYSVQKEPLPKQTTVCKSPKFRNSAPIFGEQRILEPIEMNLKKKYLASLWGLPSLYVNSLMEKWLPLPPSAVHVGGINTVSSKEKLFLNEEIRELIELHVRKKRLHQEFGLPFKLWKIFNWFTPRPSALSGPKKTKVNRVVLTKKPFFITQKTHLCLDYHIKRVQMQQRDGLPENIIQSLKHFMPSAPEIPESTPHSPIEECKGPLRDPVEGLSETRDATTRALVDAWDPKQHSQSSKQMSSPRETLKESKKTEIIFLQLHLVQKYIEIHLQQFPSRVVKSWNSVQTSEIDELAKTVLSSRISNLPRPTHLTFMEQFSIEQINQNLVHKHLMLMSAMAESSKTLAPQACTWSTTHTRPKRAVMKFVDMQTSFLAGEKRDALKCHVDPERLQYDPTLPFASQRTTVLSPMPAKLTVIKPKFPTEVNIRPVELTFIEKATEEKLVSSSRSSLASRACGLSTDKELKPQKLQMSKQESPSRGRGPMFVLAQKRNTNIFKKWSKQRRAKAMESKKHIVGTIRQCSVLDTLAIGAKWVDLNMNLENPPSLFGVLSPSTNLFPTTIHKPCSRGPRFNLDGPYIAFSAMETSFLGCKVRTHLDWHVRKKSLQQECSLPQVVQNSLQMFIPPTQHLLRSPYHREAKLKILPLIWKLEFIDEGIKEQLEFHIQRLIVQKRFGLSRHIQDELKQSLLSFPTSDAQNSDDQESVGSFSTRSEASLATKGSIAAEDKLQRFTDAYATTASQFNNQLEQHLPRKCLEVKTGVLPFLAERSLRITSSTMKTSLPKQIIQSPHVKPRATLVPFLEAENVHQVDMNIKHKHYMTMRDVSSQTLDAWDLPLGTSTPINTVSGSERNVEQKPCNRIASLFQASHGENSPAMPKQAGKDIPNTSTDASSKMAARRASKSNCIASPVQRKATFLQNLMSKLKKIIFKYGQRKIKTKKGGAEVHGPSRESGLPLKKNTPQNPNSKVRGKEKVTKRTPKIPKAITKTSSKICPVHSTPKPGKPIKTISSPFSIGDTASSGQKKSDRETHKAEDLLEQNFRVDLKDIQDGRKSLKERRKSEHVASTPIAKEDTHSTRHTLYKETSKSTQEWEANWELMSGRTARIKQSSSPEWNVQPSTASTSASCVTVEYGLDSTKTHGESGDVMSLDVIAPRGRRHRGVKTPTIQGNSSTDKSTSLMSYYPVTGKRHADRGPGYSSLSTKSSSSRHKMFCWNINAEDHI